MVNERFAAIIGIIAAAALVRLLPHPPNVAPIAAMALFAGAHVGGLWTALALPLGAMLASDAVLAVLRPATDGVHATMPFVYLAFAMVVGIGRLLRRRRTLLGIAAAALAGTLLFFALSNFGVWLVGGLYPPTADGLLACYVAALPFLRLSLLGDGFYTAILFGGFALAAARWPALGDSRSAAAT